MSFIFLKEKEKTVKKRKRKSFEKLAGGKSKAVLPKPVHLQANRTKYMEGQNTRPGLVFFISRAAKLTFLFGFDGMGI